MTAERHPTGALLDAGSLERDTESVPGRAPLRILHVIIMLGETNSQYNEHCLPSRRVRDLTICTYFRPTADEPARDRRRSRRRNASRVLPGVRRSARREDVRRHPRPRAANGSAGHVGPDLAAGTRYAFAGPSSTRCTTRFRTTRSATSCSCFPRWRRRGGWCTAAEPRRTATRGPGGGWWGSGGESSRTAPTSIAWSGRPAALTRTEDASAFRLVSVGRLENVKDPLTLLAAFRRLEDTRSRLTFVGTGCLEAELGRTIEAWSLQERAELTGLIPRDEVFARCAQADLFVSSSRGEGLPVAVIEAMATGCPVVSLRHPSSPRAGRRCRVRASRPARRLGGLRT